MAGVADAALGNAAGWAQVADLIAQTGLREQQTEESKAQTQERLLNVLAGKQQMQDNENYRKALLDGGFTLASPSGGNGGVPGASSGPPSIAETRATDTDPNTLRMQELERDKRYIAKNLELSKLHNQKDYGKWITAFDSVNTQLREVTAAVAKQKSEDFKETAQMIAGIDSPQLAETTLRHISDKYGPNAAFDVYKKLQTDTATGQVLWNDFNKDVFKTYANRVTAAHDQANIKQAGLNYELDVKKAAETAANNLRQERHGDQVVAATREGHAMTAATAAASRAQAESHFNRTEARKDAGLVELSPKEIQKREAAYPQATQAVESIEQSTDALIERMKKLRDHPGLPGITGAVYGRVPSVSGPSINAQALYDSIVSKGALNVLTALRAASKTGGALGNTSDKDIKLLKDTLGIDRVQQTGNFKGQVNEAIEELEGTKRRAREAYDSTYEYRQGRTENKETPTPAVDAVTPSGATVSNWERRK